MPTCRHRSATAVAWILAATPLAAADYAVTRYDDPTPDGCLADDCSLREAVIAANADGAADRILLSAGTYLLTLEGDLEDLSATGDLDVLGLLTLEGPGATMTTIDASGLGETAITAAAPGLVATFRGFTLTGSDSVGLLLARGDFTIEECEFTGNGDSASEAGVQLTIFGSAVIRASTIAGNFGLGLRAIQSDFTLENTTVSDNGGIEVNAINDSSISCSHCTIADPADADAELSIDETSSGSFGNGFVLGDCSGTTATVMTSLGGNVEATGDGCGFDHDSDQPSVTDPELGPLGLYGGPTRTRFPDGSSPATEGGLLENCLAVDQRGATRPFDADSIEPADCDSGSVEVTPTRPPTPIFHDDFRQGDTEAWSARQTGLP